MTVVECLNKMVAQNMPKTCKSGVICLLALSKALVYQWMSRCNQVIEYTRFFKWWLPITSLRGLRQNVYLKLSTWHHYT